MVSPGVHYRRALSQFSFLDVLLFFSFLIGIFQNLQHTHSPFSPIGEEWTGLFKFLSIQFLQEKLNKKKISEQ